MLICLGDYPLRSVTIIYNGQKFNRRRACWYVVFETDLSKANLSVEHLEENLSKVNLSVKVNLSKANLSAAGWIINNIINQKVQCVNQIP